jgi:hypothetical protein
MNYFNQLDSSFVCITRMLPAGGVKERGMKSSMHAYMHALRIE